MENNTNELTINQRANTFAFPIGNEVKTFVPQLELGKRIEITFLSMGYRNLRGVRCKCRDGRAVLTGRTSTFYEKQVAQAIAAKVAGVIAVENFIEVDR